jgi:CBS domain-containing protein
MVGIVSDYDIIKQLSGKKKPKAGDFLAPVEYSPKADFVYTTTPLPQIIELFVGSRFRRLPVVDKTDKLVGIITRRDLVKLFYYRARLT